MKAPDWKKIATTPGDPTTPPKRRPWSCVADVETVEVKWLWRPYIPFGKLTILDGDPGVGKSWICCSIAAALSKGRVLPGMDTPLPPQSVLIMSAEDDTADTIRPRLESLDADLSRVFVPNEPWQLDRRGLTEMEEKMREVAATIVFIDPITYYMGGKIDINRANEVRGLMQPLAQAAKTTGCAVVVVRHLAKASGRKDIYQGLGSIDTIAAARSGLMATQLPDGSTIMRHIKSNVAKKGPALSFLLDDNQFQWLGEYTGKDNTDGKISQTPRKVDTAATFLIEYLAQGPQPAREVIAASRAKGFSERTLTTAKKGLVESTKTPTGGWLWSLSAQGGCVLG